MCVLSRKGIIFAVMKKLFVMCACLLALMAGPATAQGVEPEVVIVRVYESAGKVLLVTTGPNGRSETVEAVNGIDSKKLAASGQAYHAVVTKLYSEGYGLTSTSTGPYAATNGTMTTLIFTKGD